jgi:signal recognition particle GTPase
MAPERQFAGNQIGASHGLRCMTTLAMSEQSDSLVAAVESRRKWSIETSLLDTVFRMHRKTNLSKDCWQLKRHCNQADGNLVEKNLLAIGRGDRLEFRVNWLVRLRGGDRRTKR